MLHREIENKAQARMIALQMADDIRQELECYNNYDVEVEDENYVKITSKQDCSIITGSCINDVIDVLNVYKKMYKYTISYHFGTEEWSLRNIPVFVIKVDYKH